MSSRVALGLLIACAVLVAVAGVQQAAAVDNFWVGPDGADWNTDWYWSLGHVPTAQYDERAIIGSTDASAALDGSAVISTRVSGTCANIQAAIDNLPASGGQVVIQAGTYTCSQAIVIDRDNVDLRGQGPPTVLRLADHANLPLLVLGQTLDEPLITRSNIRISDLTLDGNRENQDFECYDGDCGTYPIRNNGITLRRVSDVLVERVTVTRGQVGGSGRREGLPAADGARLYRRRQQF